MSKNETKRLIFPPLTKVKAGIGETMIREEFDEKLKGLNLTRKEFCEKLNVNYKTMTNHWDRKNPIPQYAISWLELYKTAQKYEQFIEILQKNRTLKVEKNESQSFTKADFDARLKELNLTRTEFCEKVGLGYSTPTTWSNAPVPLWVEAWLDTYANAESFKQLQSLFQTFSKA